MPVVLGLHAFGHDAGACVVTPKGVWALSEERLSRQKHDGGFPTLSLQWALSAARVGSLSEVDLVVYDLIEEQSAQTVEAIRALGYTGPVRAIRHHEAHAASAYFASPFGDAAVLTIDAGGTRESETGPGAAPSVLGSRAGANRELQAFFRGKDRRLLGIRRTVPGSPWNVNPGVLYGIGSMYLGFGPMGSGRLMGLAAYGKPEPGFRSPLFEDFDGEALAKALDGDSLREENILRYLKECLDGLPPRGRDEKITERHANAAAWVQHETERAVLRMATHLAEITGSTRLCFAGGFALNVTTNSLLLEQTPFEELFVQPAATDCGIPLGCALYGYHMVLEQPRGWRMTTAALGGEYSPEAVVEAVEKRPGLKIERPESIERRVADALASGRIVGWFQGRSELGPRALGHRSILADPRTKESTKRLNESIKFREPFRPYAPMVLESESARFFEPAIPSPFMLLSPSVRPDFREKLPAITHRDGTARVQTVSEAEEPRLAKLLSYFADRSGMPVLLNTSFNRDGEPIVETPDDALEMLQRTELDAVALGDFFVEKTGGAKAVLGGSGGKEAKAPAPVPEAYPKSPLQLVQTPDANKDDDLLFLFLTEDSVFLKLTRTCNNICAFCCDTVFWNGTHIDSEKIRSRMREGAAKGIKRLFLSGGEPTIHPDYLEFIKYGRELGFERISTITNGRMFYYPQFATRAVRNGLNEVIFSLNSHDEKTHDALVGVKGAYKQVVAGVENVRKLGCLYRMNVVVTSRNVDQLPDMTRAFHAMGARSATYQRIIPTDRDWERSRTIYYETEQARVPVRGAMKVARELGFEVEFTKFPDNFYEGWEDMITEPLKWALELSEIDWRRPDRHAPYKEGGAVKCWGERCNYCAYTRFCTHLMEHQAIRNEGRFDGFEVQAATPVPSPMQAAMDRQPSAPVRVLAPGAAEAIEQLKALDGRTRSVRLDSLDGVEGLPADVAVVVADGPGLEAVKLLPNPVQVELNADTAAWLQAHPDWIRARGASLTIFPQLFLRLENAKQQQVDLRETLAGLPVEHTRLVNVAPCLSGRREPSRAEYYAGEDLLREVEDVPAHSRHYFWKRYMTKSTRCGDCAMNERCDGVHINYVRVFGYESLQPIEG